ncbi:MAG: polyprenyl synthetase family protein [Deltaproteobacteria bacterium]
MDLQEYLSSKRALVDKALDEALPTGDNDAAVLHRAMRYSLFAGGKRIRPILAMAAAEAVGGRAERVLPLAVALECIHTYSLIHDDLPAMDDDDVRRGKPALHKAFGEAVAILAGDALLTFAFEVLASARVVRAFPPERLAASISELAVAAGWQYLIAGQVADIISEGKAVEVETVDRIVHGKTAALIRVSLTGGAMLAGGTRAQIEILGRFGEDLGVAFQLRDDLLDLEGDPEEMGKAVKKDQRRGKATYPNLVGKARTKEMMIGLVSSAIETIGPLGERAEPLASIGKFIVERTS